MKCDISPDSLTDPAATNERAGRERGHLRTCVRVTDFHHPVGWDDPALGPQRARWCCEQLEDGGILLLDGLPFDFSERDQEFLLSQRQGSGRVHKNISYRPQRDRLRGAAAEGKEDAERLHAFLRRYSQQTTQFVARLLEPYARAWTLDFASFRPEEEQGRNLPLHKRNDLVHVDAFPSRPTRGARILRCFTNINPTRPRVWLTADRFPALAAKFAQEAGLDRYARSSASGLSAVADLLKKAVGWKGAGQSAYDKFMLHFHDFLKEKSDFQQSCQSNRLEFPPLCTWLCFTDSVPHAVLSGQYALEQTFIVPTQALVAPEKSPIGVLEKMAGCPLTNREVGQPTRAAHRS